MIMFLRIAFWILLLALPVHAADVVGEFAETENLGGGLRKMTIHSAPIAYEEAGKWNRIETNWKDSGDGARPHAVTKSKLMTTIADDGMRRIHPTRDLNKYIEIGCPYVKPAANWVKVPWSGAQRSGNRMTWTRPEADMSITHAGHYLKLDIELKGGYVPPTGKFAFPVGIQGLTRSGNQILDGEKVVMVLRRPVAYDAANPVDVREIQSQFVSVDGQSYILFLLPDLAGMSRPVVDPTFTLQPDNSTLHEAMFRDSDVSSNYQGGIQAGEINAGSGAARSAIKLDLSGVPKSIKIVSSSLKLTVSGDYSSNARTLRLFRLKRVVVFNQVTWTVYSTANNWQTAGGFGANDCEQTDIGTASVTATQAVGSVVIINITPNTTGGMDLGNGWLLKMDTETDDQYIFYASGDATPTNRPKLEITYRLLNAVIMF